MPVLRMLPVPGMPTSMSYWNYVLEDTCAPGPEDELTEAPAGSFLFVALPGAYAASAGTGPAPPRTSWTFFATAAATPKRWAAT